VEFIRHVITVHHEKKEMFISRVFVAPFRLFRQTRLLKELHLQVFMMAGPIFICCKKVLETLLLLFILLSSLGYKGVMIKKGDFALLPWRGRVGTGGHQRSGHNKQAGRW